LIVGDIAEGGGDFSVVSEVELLVTVLFVVDSVIIGGFVVSVVVVVCAFAVTNNEDITKLIIIYVSFFNTIVNTPNLFQRLWYL
jgi:hypothetical protein